MASPSQPQGHRRVAFLPNVPIRLKGSRKAVQAEPQTVGEHIKQVRLAKGLTQKGAAALLGIDQYTVINWEKGRTEPPATAYPAILVFLGYDPHPKPQTIPERLLALRRRRGWIIRQAADELAVDEGTWGDWERGKPIAWKRIEDQVRLFLTANEASGG